jgi:hypothetical protein
MLDYNNQYDMSTINSAERLGEVIKAQETQRKREAQKGAAILQTAVESKKQNQLLSAQIDELKEQKKLLSEQVVELKEQNQVIKETCENAKAEAVENQKQAKQNKVFGWVSFAVGTVIGIIGIVLGIVF